MNPQTESGNQNEENAFDTEEENEEKEDAKMADPDSLSPQERQYMELQQAEFLMVATNPYDEEEFKVRLCCPFNDDST